MHLKLKFAKNRERESVCVCVSTNLNYAKDYLKNQNFLFFVQVSLHCFSGTKQEEKQRRRVKIENVKATSTFIAQFCCLQEASEGFCRKNFLKLAEATFGEGLYHRVGLSLSVLAAMEGREREGNKGRQEGAKTKSKL